MPTSRSALLFIVTALAQPVSAQECKDLDTPGFADSLARQYAPFLWFSPREEYFPTIPFFPAFDTVAPRAPGLVGLRDPERVIQTRQYLHPPLPVHPLILRDLHGPVVDSTRFLQGSWDNLDSAWTKRRKDLVTPPHSIAVFYRVRCLDGGQSGTLWTFLRNDTQAWWRSKIWDLYDRGLQHANFFSVEYYLHYVRDVGLQGHPGDVEKISVLRPINPPASERGSNPPIDGMLLDQLRIIIGAGHGFTTPNNILVEIGPSQDDPLKQEYAHPHVLVELGGHSIAPDRAPPDGRFNLGWDVNWNSTETVWGVRDVQGVSGSGFLGAYKEWMTMPRYAGNSVRLSPRFAPSVTVADTAARSADSVAVAIEFDKAIEQQEQQDAPRVPTPPAADSARGDYLLLPVGPFESLFRLLAADAALGDLTASKNRDHVATHDSIRRVLKQEVQPLLSVWKFTGFDGMAPESVDATIHLMHYWTKPLGSQFGDVLLSRMHIWEDFEFKNVPSFMLKRYLYRPTQNGLRTFPSDYIALLTTHANFYVGRDGGKQFQIGILYPPGTRSIMNIPGVMELQFGLYGRKAAQFGRNRLSVSLLYDRHYRRLFSWYLRPFSWVRKRREYESDSTASDVVLGFGGSVMPFLFIADKLRPPWRHIATTTRVRAGFRIDMLGFRPNPSRVEVQISLYAR